MPSPRSPTAMPTRPSAMSAETVISVCGRPYLMALSSRFWKTCDNSSALPSTADKSSVNDDSTRICRAAACSPGAAAKRRTFDPRQPRFQHSRDRYGYLELDDAPAAEPQDGVDCGQERRIAQRGSEIAGLRNHSDELDRCRIGPDNPPVSVNQNQ